MARLSKTKPARLDPAFLQDLNRWHEHLVASQAHELIDLDDLNRNVRAITVRLLFGRILEERGISVQANSDGGAGMPSWGRHSCLPILQADKNVCPTWSSEVLCQVHEHLLGRVIRRAANGQLVIEDSQELKKPAGAYYTPAPIVDRIVGQTLGKLLEDKTLRQARDIRILDPACGAGSFLLGAYRYLLDWHQARCLQQLAWEEKVGILRENIHGIDIDPQAVEVTRMTLLLQSLEGAVTVDRLPDLTGNIKCGNALIGPDFLFGPAPAAFDWRTEFPDILNSGGFDAVIGNPPWGQKAVSDDPNVKHYVWSRFPSCQGIYDLFRPFIELGIQLLKQEGMFGMILPDIVLLKNCTETRRYLLDHLAIEAIDWWRMPFPAAVIDAASIVGCKRPAEPDHEVQVAIHDRQPLFHAIPQADFRENPRFLFNLHLTPEKRRLLHKLETCPRLGDYFEVHEGVHSGNLRAQLFVGSRLDESCRELYFGRGEITPYSLQWQGQYVRLAALPDRKTRQAYANLGKPEWHERPKVLVRRTGDFVLAAVDRLGRYASNNFFLVFARRECSIDLDGLCALLNSSWMTWYFRANEPRQGRVFAELKIKHLSAFPLPPAIQELGGCDRLNFLGSERSALGAEKAAPSDARIDETIRELFGLSPEIATLAKPPKASKGKRACN